MELVKKSGDHTIWKKRSGRYAVKTAANAFLHGEEKINILRAEGLQKPPAAGKKAEAPAGEPAADAQG